LSHAQREEICRVVSTTLSTGVTLLERLTNQILGERSAETIRSNIPHNLNSLLDSPIAKFYARNYMKPLGWYGVEPGQTPSEEDLQQLLITAVLLNIHPAVGQNELKNRV